MEDLSCGLGISSTAQSKGLCSTTLSDIHSEYNSILNAVDSKYGPSPIVSDVLASHHLRGAQLMQEIQNQELFMELWKYTDTLESINASLVAQLQIVSQEKDDLRVQLEHAHKELRVAQDNVIQLETDKQQVDFLYELKLSECEELTARMTDNEDSVTPSQRILSQERFSPRANPYTSSGGKKTPLICDSTAKAKLTTASTYRRNKENSPSSRVPFNEIGNLTMRFNGLANQSFGTDDIDLEELTDKLSWYESVVRQLQSILAVEVDDPDATYHQECTKVLERAKRAMEYREMIRDYEVMIGENREEIERLRVTRDCLLEEAETTEKENKEKLEQLERLRVCELDRLEEEHKNEVQRLSDRQTYLIGKLKKSTNITRSVAQL